MGAKTDRLTVIQSDEMRERVEKVKDEEGFEHDTEVGRELIRRGLDDWEQQHATYPGSEFVERAIELSAVGFVVGVTVSAITTSGLVLEQTGVLAGVVALFVGVHYAALLAEGQPSAEPDDVRDAGAE